MTDRPVECSGCKKPVTILYKEIFGDNINCTEMCADCPFLHSKLHGDTLAAPSELRSEGSPSTLYCERCHTALDAIKMGNPLGCIACYSIFADPLVKELAAAQQIPAHLAKEWQMSKNQSLHVGHSPTQPATIPASHRLTTLNEALNEALRIENYEQAAWLRDQINALTEKPHEGKNSA